MSKLLMLVFSLYPKYPSFQLFVSLSLAMFLCILLTPALIKFFTARKIGQVVRTDGPEPHLKKQGTPTMGGIAIILSAVVSWAAVSATRGYSLRGFLVLGVVLACGLIGLIDDYLKTARRRSLGLKARHKLILQLLVSLLFSYVAIEYAGLPTTVELPLTGFVLELGPLYPVFVYLIIAATTNTVNLTDGLDGLAAGTVAIASAALAAIAFREKMPDLAFFAAAIAGASAGFLWWNAYPARIFMGDTGSLSLGGAIAVISILTKTELFLPLIGGIFVIEGISVILQVLSFRMFKKRIFKMAPIHHHFEMLGWSETQIMIRFWILAGFLSGLGFALYFTGGL